jgi:hypothetical protein
MYAHVDEAIPAGDKANYYKEKLKALQFKAGLGNNEEPMDNRVDDFNRNHQQREVKNRFYSILKIIKLCSQVFENLPRSVLAESNITSPPKTDAASLELIKQRLERLKR